MVNRHIQNSNTNNIDSNLRWFDDYVLSPKSNDRFSESNDSGNIMGNSGSGGLSGHNGRRSKNSGGAGSGAFGFGDEDDFYKF